MCLLLQSHVRHNIRSAVVVIRVVRALDATNSSRYTNNLLRVFCVRRRLLRYVILPGHRRYVGSDTVCVCCCSEWHDSTGVNRMYAYVVHRIPERSSSSNKWVHILAHMDTEHEREHRVEFTILYTHVASEQSSGRLTEKWPHFDRLWRMWSSYFIPYIFHTQYDFRPDYFISRSSCQF